MCTDEPEGIIGVDIISTLSVQDEQDGCQQFVHPLTIAQVRMLLDIAEENIHHHLPARSEDALS